MRLLPSRSRYTTSILAFVALSRPRQSGSTNVTDAARVFRCFAAFLRELEAKLLAFPSGKYDDQVDSVTQALASGSKYGGYDTSLNWVMG